MKRCFKCKKEKPLSEFYAHAAMTDGHLGKCKKCSKKDVRTYQERNKNNQVWAARDREVHRASMARRRARGLSKSDPKAAARWSKRNKIKRRAQGAAGKAMKKGLIKMPEKCAGCGEKRKLEKHHSDYSKPLEVVWFCQPCHGKTRRK